MGGGITVQVIKFIIIAVFLMSCWQWLLERFNKKTRLIDVNLMERLSGTSLDFLITGAVASGDSIESNTAINRIFPSFLTV